MSSLLLLALLFHPVSKSDHAIYISVLEISRHHMEVKVFTDDLDDAIRNDASTIEKYFQKKIRLKVGNEKWNFDLQNVRKEGDSYWITFRLDERNDWQSTYLEADYFLELFPTQTNVIRVLSKKPQFFKLTKSNPSCRFNL